MEKIHPRWLVPAAIVSSVAGLVMCPVGSLVMATALFLISLDMTPRLLDCRLQATIVCTAVLAAGMMALIPSATSWWALFACPPMVLAFGRPKPDDIERHDAAKPERPWEKKKAKGRRHGVVINIRGAQQQLPSTPVIDLREVRTVDDKTVWRQ